jgi:uncharacterized protein YndB with AHSA1/START domain
MSSQGKTIVQVIQEFSASPERVFDAWLEPAMLGQWMFGAALRDEVILHLHVDALVGGKFSFLVRRQGTEIDHIGTYLEIDRPHRLVFTWGIAGESDGDSTVAIDIKPIASGSELTLTHTMDAKWAEYADRTKQGWTKMVGVLAKVLT